MKNISKYMFPAFFSLALITSCQKEYVEPSTVGEAGGGSSTAVISYSADVQSIFTSKCIGCHAGSQAPDLTAANSYAALVSNASPANKYVDVAAPSNSFLYQKVTGTQTAGGQMPLGGSALSANETNAILQWITQGVQNN